MFSLTLFFIELTQINNTLIGDPNSSKPNKFTKLIQTQMVLLFHSFQLFIPAAFVIFLFATEIACEDSPSPLAFEQLTLNSKEIDISFSKDSNFTMKLFQFTGKTPRDALLQLHNKGDKNTTHQRDLIGPEIIFEVYEFETQDEAKMEIQKHKEVMKQNQIGQKSSGGLNAQDLTVILSNSHNIDHSRFVPNYFYAFCIRKLSFLGESETNNEPKKPDQPEDENTKKDEDNNKNNASTPTNNSDNTNKSDDTSDEDNTVVPFSYELNLKYLSESDMCNNSGFFKYDSGLCVCNKNKLGNYCEFDLLHITSYYQFEVQLKQFEGKYLQIYKASTDQELRLEMTLKHSNEQDIYFYRSATLQTPLSQHNYAEKFVFNDTHLVNIVNIALNEQSVLLFVRNPSQSYVYFKLAVQNYTTIDDGEVLFFVSLSLVATLLLSFLCIFCVNKISNGKRIKKNISAHVELQESQEESNKQKEMKENNNIPNNNNNNNNPGQQNGSSNIPQTNRNLIDDIMTQREIQIKSEMDQITKSDRYEQFQLETSFKEQICAICLDDFEYNDQVRKTKCNHMFHEKCLYKWLFKYISCPMCNQDIT